MSWSMNCIGTAAAIKAELARQSAQLTGQSKVEFDEAKPAIETILSQNVGQGPALLSFEGNGHANFTDGVRTYGTCSIKVTPLSSRLVTE